MQRSEPTISVRRHQYKYRRPYPVPQVHLETSKKDLYHLVDIGVLSPVTDTEWGLPTLMTPKKDGTVKWVSDLRELNKVVKKIEEKVLNFLLNLIYLSMMFYTFALDEEAQKCVQ